MYELYRFDNSSKSIKEIPYTIEKWPIYKNGFNRGMGRKRNLVWFLLTFGRTYVYYCFDGQKKVHQAYVMKSCFKFPFLKKGDIHIGPCHTPEKYRGQGIYPAVIRKITEDFELKEGGKTGYMIVEETNLPSIKGVEKAGLKKCGALIRSRFLKIYKEHNNV